MTRTEAEALIVTIDKGLFTHESAADDSEDRLTQDEVDILFALRHAAEKVAGR